MTEAPVAFTQLCPVFIFRAFVETVNTTEFLLAGYVVQRVVTKLMSCHSLGKLKSRFMGE